MEFSLFSMNFKEIILLFDYYLNSNHFFLFLLFNIEYDQSIIKFCYLITSLNFMCTKPNFQAVHSKMYFL